MIRSLRKGMTFVELNHKFGTDTVCGENTEVELVGNKATFRTTLKPAGSNQIDDVERFEENKDYDLEGVLVMDSQIRQKLSSFLKANTNISKLEIELKYKKTQSYSAELVLIDDDGILFNL